MKTEAFLASAMVFLLLGLTVPGGAAPKMSVPQAIEVGIVKWNRDLQGALTESGKSGRPVLLLFQEVPGCSGCRKFGREVLSHPDIVAAIEEEFIPVLVYNNRPGRDAEILARYDEPAWNYQVIRFLDGSGNDFIPRKDRVWTVRGVALRMIEALEALGREAPLPLRRLAGKSL